MNYDDAPYPIPQRIADAHSRYWQRLAVPGTWWTGAERIAIAREVRRSRTCSLCTARHEALSPNAVDGDHDADSALPADAVEAVHRLTTDPGRLTLRWYEGVTGGKLSAGRYVELLGTVVHVFSIDEFCRALGLELHPLPEPEAGAPSEYHPASAAMEDAWVPMIPASDNSGDEADLWRTGRTGNVIRALSLVPDEVRSLNELSRAHYLPNERVADPTARGEFLDRPQMELIAGRISALNQCYY